MKTYLLGSALLLLCIALGLFLRVQPSNDRAWTEDQRVLAEIVDRGEEIDIRHIRNFSYQSTSTYTPGYYDATYRPRDLTSVDFIVVPFEGIGAAHTMLSFGFSDGRYLTISVEIRKEQGESFSPWRGVLKQYEIMYVIADERDVIDLRANHRKNDVYVYPVMTTHDNMEALFRGMLARAESLRHHPEFYNTIGNNCTVAITKHVNALNPERVPWNYTFIFPRNADVYAKELGLIAPGMSIEEARETYRINERAKAYQGSPDFSALIRANH